MKGSRLGSAIQISRGNPNTNLSDIDKDVSSSSQPQNNIVIISGSFDSSATSRTALLAPTKTSFSEIINPKRSSTLESSNISNILSKPQFSHYSQPRPKHPLTLISFPFTGGNNDGDNEVVVTPTIPPNASYGGNKLFGSFSTGKELLWDEKFATTRMERNNPKIVLTKTTYPSSDSAGGDRDGWITSEEHFHDRQAPLYKVPKPSHIAKKLRKPYSSSSLILPSSANSSHSSHAAIGEGNSPAATTPFSSSSSNNIDNKKYKPKRNKTAKAETGFRKRLNTNSTISNTPITTKRGLVFLSTAKGKVANTNSQRNETENEDIFLAEKGHGQQQQQSGLNGPPPTSSSSGIRLMSGTGQSNWKVLSDPVNLTKSMASLSTKLNERVQVIRTKEEREQSPESIRMDGLGLKVFPAIGGGEGPNLKLLSLQRNLIKYLENTPSHLSHLVVLDLYDNRIERISLGLLGFTSLRVLLLGKNRIRRIEGLEGLKRLEILDLHGNQLRYVDNLGVLSSLRVLNLAGNILRSIRNLGPNGINTLTELNLKRNRIRNLDGLVKAPHLKKLLLANNDLQSFASLLPLRKLSLLQELLLESNPLSSTSDCRHQVLSMLPWLTTLDHVEMTEAMRVEARQWYKRKLVEEEDRRREASSRLCPTTTSPKVGSREQTIYQARRRWESVRKNFVKNTNSKPTNPSSPFLSGANEKGTLGKIGTGDPVRSEIDDDLNSHFRWESRSETLSRGNSSKESKSMMKQLVLEYPAGGGTAGDVKLNFAQSDSDLDQHQPISVNSGEGGHGGRNIKRMPQPEEDSCPPSVPSMINDLRPPPNPMDYVNTNSNSNSLVSSKQVQKQEQWEVDLHESHTDNYHQHWFHVENRGEIGVASQTSQQKETQLLLSSQAADHDDDDHSPQMDSSITTNIIKEEESAQSPLDGYHPRKRKRTLTQTFGAAEDDDDSSRLTKNVSQQLCSKSIASESSVAAIPKTYKGSENAEISNSNRIAVVRPLLRDDLCPVDETIITSNQIFYDFTTMNSLPDVLSPRAYLPTNNTPMMFGDSINSVLNNKEAISEIFVPHRTIDDVTITYANNDNDNNSKLSNNDEAVSPESPLSPSVKDLQYNTFQSNQLTLISPASDQDKIIRSNESEIMIRTLLKEDVTLGNMSRSESFPTCLPNFSNCGAREETTCPTFTFETLDQQRINEEKETCIINNNPTGTSATQESTLSSLSVSANILEFPSVPSDSPLPTSSPSTNANISTQNSAVDNCSGNAHNDNKPNLRKLKLRSASFDGRLLSSSRGAGSDDDEHYDVDDDDTCSNTTATTGSTTTIATTTSDMKLGFARKQLNPRTRSSQKLKVLRDRPSRAQSSSCIATTPRAKSGTLGTLSSSSQTISSTTVGSSSGVSRVGQGGDTRGNRQMRRCESAVGGSGLTGTCPLENSGASNLSPTPLKRQGTDYLVEIDGKILSIYGQAMKHTLTGFSGNVTCTVTTAKFHYISYDTIIPFFGKLRQIYPSLEHFQFRANNIEKLSQLNSLSDLQGLTSLHIAKEGNPLVSQDTSWVGYATYRLSHWGLLNVNGEKE
ncbi:uncharacterized protein LOC110843635 isoform X3 [Folsomia candida]|nr:uncharacterized protein LOC110843635 isoform X3 [Folsomia candida]